MYGLPAKWMQWFMLSAPVYRARVVYSDATTGAIKVQAPALCGANSVLPISYVGRYAVDGVWAVPPVGMQVVITSDDANLTNVFILNVTPPTGA